MPCCGLLSLAPILLVWIGSNPLIVLVTPPLNDYNQAGTPKFSQSLLASHSLLDLTGFPSSIVLDTGNYL